LNLDGATAGSSIDAAMRLYLVAGEQVSGLLSPEQQGVFEASSGLIEEWIGTGPTSRTLPA
jgi:hypothetical protein